MIRFQTEQPLSRDNEVLSRFLDSFFDTAVIVDTHLNIINYGASPTQLYSDRFPELLGKSILSIADSTPFASVIKSNKDLLYQQHTLNGHPAIQSLHLIYVKDEMRGVLATSSYINMNLLLEQLFSEDLFSSRKDISPFSHKTSENPLILSHEQLEKGDDTLEPLLDAIFDSAIYISKDMRVIRCGMGKLELTKEQREEMLEAKTIRSFDDTSPYEFVFRTGRSVRDMLSLVLGRQCLNSICPIFDAEDNLIAVVGGIQFSCLDAIRSQFIHADRLSDDIEARLHKNYLFDDFVGNSEPTKQLLEICRKYAASDYPVLIMGESGTGKEIIAGAIHSAKMDHEFKPYVKINCTAIPNDLLESELFGHEKGAFTGATSMKKGKFEIANGGTVLLDEIGDMDLRLQSKLLRVLEEKIFERIGGSTEIKLDARIIASTNCDLFRKCQEGTFRLDLYYRLNMLEIKIPALKERKSDIPHLISHFLIQNGAVVGIRPSAMKLFMDYDWPGNVRELRNVVNRICILHDGESISADQVIPCLQNSFYMPEQLSASPMETVDKTFNYCTLQEAEERLIRATLEHENYNINKSAISLGISRATLYNKMAKYGIQH